MKTYACPSCGIPVTTLGKKKLTYCLACYRKLRKLL